MSSWLANLTGVHISPKKAYIDKRQLTRAALTAGGLALGGIGGKVAGKVVGALAPKLGGLFGGGAGAMTQDMADDAMQFATPQAPGRFRRILSSIDGDDVLKYGKAAGDAYGAYDDMKRRNRMENIANAEFNRRGPARDAAQRILLNESRPDLSDVFDEQPRRFRRVSVGSY